MALLTKSHGDAGNDVRPYGFTGYGGRQELEQQSVVSLQRTLRPGEVDTLHLGRCICSRAVVASGGRQRPQLPLVFVRVRVGDVEALLRVVGAVGYGA